MKGNRMLRNQEGFTLVEIIAVLIILGILAAVAVPRYIDLEENAKERAIDAAISELNGRESLTWADAKISQTGYLDDAQVWSEMTVAPAPSGGPDLGESYVWNALPTAGTSADIARLSFKGGADVPVKRVPSTGKTPANWKKQ